MAGLARGVQVGDATVKRSRVGAVRSSPFPPLPRTPYAQRPRRSLGSLCPICVSAVQDFTSAGHYFLLGILPSPQIQPL